jgi:hypothetical protein
MPEPNGGQTYGEILQRLAYIEHDQADFDRRMVLVEGAVSETRAIFHLMTRKEELTVKNLEMSITTHYFTRALGFGQITIWLITAIWIIAHTPRIP